MLCTPLHSPPKNKQKTHIHAFQDLTSKKQILRKVSLICGFSAKQILTATVCFPV